MNPLSELADEGANHFQGITITTKKGKLAKTLVSQCHKNLCDVIRPWGGVLKWGNIELWTEKWTQSTEIDIFS